MKNLFLPLSTVESLKAIGFDEPCIMSIDSKGVHRIPRVGAIPAPLIDQVIEWFVDNHNISIEPRAYFHGKWNATIRTIGDVVIDIHPLNSDMVTNRYDAVVRGIERAIRLVRNVTRSSS